MGVGGCGCGCGCGWVGSPPPLGVFDAFPKHSETEQSENLTDLSFQVKEAEEKIDKFIEKQQKENQISEEKAKYTAGCKTVENKTVINNKESEEDKRKRESEDIKELGNQAFRSGNFKIAEEYYTSAILKYENNHILFTNRAQARIRQEKFQDAVDDCKEAIKIKQDSVKTILIIVRALRGLKDFQKALDMLEIAEKIPNVDMKVVENTRRELVTELKKNLLEKRNV